ncbi:MAG: hypothetical protein AB7O59_10405 [Pirellulales bacterium]
MLRSHLRAGLLTVLAASAWSLVVLAAVPALADDRRNTSDDDPFAGPAEREPGAPAAAVAAQGSNAAEARPAQPPTRDDRELEERIQTALKTPTHMEFVETPLQDAVDYLKDLHGIEIQLDSKALEDEGIGSDTPMTRSLKGLSLDSSLRLLLEPLDLTFVVRHGVLEITTHDAVKKMIELRVYSVQNLISEELDVEDIAKVARLATVDPFAAPIPGGVTVPAPQQVRPAEEESQPIIVPFGELLVVRGSIAEHERLADLLDKIREKLPHAAR